MHFSDEEQQHFTNILSDERLSHWRELVRDPATESWRARVGCRLPPTDESAVLLHEWNATLAAAFLATLQILELSLRNHMHDALSAHFGSTSWWGTRSGNHWTSSAHVALPQRDDVNRAITVSGRRRKGVTPGGVVSELSFGFWLALLGPAYDNPSGGMTHWRDCLHTTFDKSGRVSRKDIHRDLESIVRLRNRCAHHQPIVTLDLRREYALMLHFTRRFSRPTANWIERTSLIPHLLKPDWLQALRTAGRIIGSP